MIIRGLSTAVNISKRSERTVFRGDHVERVLIDRCIDGGDDGGRGGADVKQCKVHGGTKKKMRHESGRVNEKNNIGVSRECAHPVPTCELCKRGYMICLFYRSCSERRERERERENTMARHKSRPYFKPHVPRVERCAHDANA